MNVYSVGVATGSTHFHDGIEHDIVLGGFKYEGVGIPILKSVFTSVF